MASVIRKGRSEEKSTKVRGGYYKLPKNAKGSKPKRGSQSKGAYARSYHNQMHQRTGHYGSSAGAQKFTATNRRGLAASGVGLAGILGGKGVSKIAPRAGAALAVAGVGATLYGNHKSNQGTRQVNRDSGTKRSAISGFYSTHPNQSNAKTGVRSGSPSRVKFGSRVGSK